jgi:hypothetical protein
MVVHLMLTFTSIMSSKANWEGFTSSLDEATKGVTTAVEAPSLATVTGMIGDTLLLSLLIRGSIRPNAAVLSATNSSRLPSIRANERHLALG